MWMTLVSTFGFIFTVTYGRVLLYHTENDQTVEKFDCVYYVHDDGQEIPYCRRLDGSHQLNQKKDRCENQGEIKWFRYLLDQSINPSDILTWSSSVEMADMYANVYYNRSLLDQNNERFVCNCTKSGTFGKYCEYQLTHYAESFGEAIKAQFEQKKSGDSWNTQRFGRILCYNTLVCTWSNLCHDWRDICDGIQQCYHGLDEENWDKLEFNECENDEFRCVNGMCIPEKFWLDGDYDCMDWSDETRYGLNGEWCPFEPNAMECDEHICGSGMYSCGDGQCVTWTTRVAFQGIEPQSDDCFNKRNLNYMCEVSPHRRAWTLESGLCWSDETCNDPRYSSWDMMNSSTISNDTKCEYLFRCVLSDGFEYDCPCNQQNCTQMMMSVCSGEDQLVLYPPLGLINPNVFFYYNYSRSLKNPSVEVIRIHGEIKCRGYHFSSNLALFDTSATPRLILHSNAYHVLCFDQYSVTGNRNFSSYFQYDKFCWNESLTFNGHPYAVNPDVCPDYGQCISQYRIHDGYENCLDPHDEEMVLKNNYCTGNVGRQRFQCFNNEHKCLPLDSLGSGYSSCSNNYDEMWHGIGLPLSQNVRCWKGDISECYRWKEYIEQSSVKNSSSNSSFDNSQQESTADQIPFRSYCDSFWDLNRHIDELASSCQYWVCKQNQYQCQTGQCIELDWVCDGEWDGVDASDEEATELVQNQSVDNAHLLGLNNRMKQCRQRYFQSPFSNICNTSFGFGCYLSRVLDPLDIKSNRPCINLTQIGDGVKDCYNAYDEKNTFEQHSEYVGMWGFHFRCGTNVTDYPCACSRLLDKRCTKVLCPNLRDEGRSCSKPEDVICLGNNHCMKSVRCDGKLDCFYGEDEYWCHPSDSLQKQFHYRIGKRSISQQHTERLRVVFYPFERMLVPNQQYISKSIINPRNDHFFNAHSFQCNRGVAIVHINETRCLCPPAYYGRWCEFFSDRISIIAHVDQKILPKTISNVTLKIKTNFLFNNMIIDHHEFSVIPIFESVKNIKHKFYLLYSRSDHMLAHKIHRYINRTDIINNHPYAVHFDVFSLETNNSIIELGSWYYPIYFDYLPAFRLSVVLKFPSWFGNTTFDPCSKNICNQNSTCMPIFNQNNSYYCSCKNGYHGKNCGMYERRCETYCSANALCRRSDNSLQIKKINPYCVCPLGRFGPRCNLKYDGCDLNPCSNKGTCLPTYDLSGEAPYICICSEQFYGNQCQDEKACVRVVLNMTSILSARATVVQLYDITDAANLFIQHQQVYHGLPSTILYDHADVHAPSLGLFKIYENTANPQYFIMYLLFQSKINITSSPLNCPHASSLLSKDTSSFVPAIFKYHHICQNDTKRFCFYDENYFCVCQTNNYRVECFLHDIQIDHCANCLSEGKCLQGDRKNLSDFVCLCPLCHQGSLCEFSMQAFGFTLDSLLVDYSKQIKIIYASLVFLLFTIGFFNNLCSFVTFRRPTPRKFAVGNYLLVVTCLNQGALFCLLFKFISIIAEASNTESCKVVSYFISVFTRSTFWLTSWVTVDRLLTVIFPTSVTLRKPRLAVGMSTATLVVLLGMHVHEISYHTIVQHLPTGSSICVTNFDTRLISIYNRTSTLIHYLLPFFIQIIAITLLIVLATHNRIKISGQKMTFRQVLNKQFQAQKELYVTPTIIVFSALPQTILTFSFACTQLADWQRHALLSAFLLSYAPQVLGFILYVLPSTSYKKEFSQTSLAKTLSKCMLTTRTRMK